MSSVDRGAASRLSRALLMAACAAVGAQAVAASSDKSTRSKSTAGSKPAAAAPAAAPADPATGAAPSTPTAPEPRNGKMAPASQQNLKPRGPMTIDADNAQLIYGQSMLYTGHVRLNSQDLQLAGDRLEMHQFPNKEFTAHVTGDPATLFHKGFLEKNGEVGPPVNAKAKTLDYDSRTDTVTVNGDAYITQGDRKITGENIVYNVVNRSIEAQKGATGQVHMEFNPPDKSATPAPGAPGGTAPATPSPVGDAAGTP